MHLLLIMLTSWLHTPTVTTVEKFPANKATEVNPDTYLRLTFPGLPTLHNTGTIRVFDAANDQLVDVLDLSISPGPKNTRTLPPYDGFQYAGIPDSLYSVKNPDEDSTHIYQQDYIGGTSALDAYHFYPVFMAGHDVIICLHHNKLAYGHTYYVQIDRGVFSLADGSAFAITGKTAWVFHTKAQAPATSRSQLVVSADGTGDFTTVQGAVDFLPLHHNKPVTIFIKKGVYREIVHFHDRQQVRFLGEDRDSVIICYPNNSVFNRRVMSPDPALAAGRHSLRPVLSIYNAEDVAVKNLTLRSLGDAPAQAEALLIIGQRMVVYNVAIEGSGDALQATGTVYVEDSKIQGFGDNVLGYGAVYFYHCHFISFYGPHIWVRNTNQHHGNVLVDCTLQALDEVSTHIARAPDNHGFIYPYCETVLIDCKLQGIRPEGWGQVTAETAHIHYWEYHSTDLASGQPVDTGQRHPASRQLTLPADAALIQQYRDPAFVLEGWNPQPVKP